ncbi:hypothetical protein B0H66DRAFT_628542 [Apodospora peruviana]|uniref:Uncharacterized protein n=1 Tax=Apodospora peruviana TaxID=516989 RepID=A0AAE0M1D7_9PEZI|nr:hypothetical protein B0H66DRAFT_628542 [Apodospora peruviana]
MEPASDDIRDDRIDDTTTAEAKEASSVPREGINDAIARMGESNESILTAILQELRNLREQQHYNNISRVHRETETAQQSQEADNAEQQSEEQRPEEHLPRDKEDAPEPIPEPSPSDEFWEPMEPLMGEDSFKEFRSWISYFDDEIKLLLKKRDGEDSTTTKQKWQTQVEHSWQNCVPASADAPDYEAKLSWFSSLEPNHQIRFQESRYFYPIAASGSLPGNLATVRPAQKPSREDVGPFLDACAQCYLEESAGEYLLERLMFATPWPATEPRFFYAHTFDLGYQDICLQLHMRSFTTYAGAMGDHVTDYGSGAGLVTSFGILCERDYGWWSFGKPFPLTERRRSIALRQANYSEAEESWQPFGAFAIILASNPGRDATLRGERNMMDIPVGYSSQVELCDLLTGISVFQHYLCVMIKQWVRDWEETLSSIDGCLSLAELKPKD